MVRVFNQNTVVCEILLVLENNCTPLAELENVLAKVREEIGTLPVVIAPSGLPAELSEQHERDVIGEVQRRKSAYCIGYDASNEPDEPSERTGDEQGVVEEPDEDPKPTPMEHEFSFGFPGAEGTEE